MDEVDRLQALLAVCDRVLPGLDEGPTLDEEIWQQVRKTCRMVKARLAELATSDDV